MRKIILFGNSGSGKSTLAKELATAEKLSHLDLDNLAWLPSVPPARTPLLEVGIKIQEFMDTNSCWVIEGCYTDLLELVSPHASEAIFMDLSVEQCKENALNRPWEPHKYESKEAQDNNLDMLLDWIQGYVERDDVFSHQTHSLFFQNFTGIKTKYTANQRSV